ncbi:hypothetical protein GCM10009836_01130 [Pseudonocardia ailaonensis]|uniref:HTH tetR-type domain-containing protein n=1 Tax=Pseudonocardia ailaonensis TaxID=367279 RepID=A0ABN2MJQ1_9PSEU
MSRSEKAAAGHLTVSGEISDDERKAPERRSPRARRTRASLVAGARTVFERDGFQSAKITDIAEAAGVAIGSFYTHFRSKEEIFLAVMDEVEEEMLHPHRDLSGSRAETLYDSILAANRRYLEAYRKNAALMAVLEEFATINEGFRAIRIRRAVAFSERNARTIERFQEKGVADAELDAYLAAHSLSGMVSRAAYQAFVLRTSTDEMEMLVRTLTRLWLNALGIGREDWADPV